VSPLASYSWKIFSAYQFNTPNSALTILPIHGETLPPLDQRSGSIFFVILSAVEVTFPVEISEWILFSQTAKLRSEAKIVKFF